MGLPALHVMIEKGVQTDTLGKLRARITERIAALQPGKLAFSDYRAWAHLVALENRRDLPLAVSADALPRLQEQLRADCELVLTTIETFNCLRYNQEVSLGENDEFLPGVCGYVDIWELFLAVTVHADVRNPYWALLRLDNWAPSGPLSVSESQLNLNPNTALW